MTFPQAANRQIHALQSFQTAPAEHYGKCCEWPCLRLGPPLNRTLQGQTRIGKKKQKQSLLLPCTFNDKSFHFENMEEKHLPEAVSHPCCTEVGFSILDSLESSWSLEDWGCSNILKLLKNVCETTFWGARLWKWGFMVSGINSLNATFAQFWRISPVIVWHRTKSQA